MAYNYEYPYVDPGVYNDDWLIHSMQKLIEDWAKFNTDVVDKWDEFLINAKEQYDSFTSEILQIQENFENDFNTKWDDYQTELNTAWISYKERLDGEWDVFKSSITSQQTQFETDMEDKFTAFITNQNSAWIEYKNNLTADFNEFKSTVSTRISTYEDTVNTEIEDMRTDISNFKTYVNDYLNNLDITAEISNKVEDMVNDGSFANITRPQTEAAANSWLSQHITNPSNPPLDTSLRVGSAAAESMRSGYRIYPLLQNCGLLIISGGYRDDFVNDDTVIGATGMPVMTSGYKTTDPVPFFGEQGQYINFVISSTTNDNYYSIGFYDTEFSFISGYREYHEGNSPAPIRKFKVPNGTSYIRACMDFTGSPPFCCIVGDQDPLWANFALRSRFYSATEAQKNGIDTSNGTLQSTAAVNSTIWFDIAQNEPVGKIEFDSFLDTKDSMTEQWRISFVVGNLERLYMRLLRNKISLLNNAGNEISGSAVDYTLGRKHVTLIRANQLLLIYMDGVLLTGFSIKDILQVGYYIIQSSSLISNFNYQPLKIRRPKVAVTIDTCFWMANPLPLLEQLRTIHNKYNCDITLHITGSMGEESLDTITPQQSQEFIVDNGWLKFATYREALSTTVTVNGLSDLKAKIVNKFGWRSYDPYPIIVNNNIGREDLINLYNRHVILGITSLSADLANQTLYGLSEVEENVLKSGCYYPDLKTGLTYYMCIGDVYNDAHLSNLESRIYTQTIIAKMNVPIILAALGSETEIGEKQLTRLNKALTYYYNKAGIALP